MACPLLIALPRGLGVGGVNTWAVRLVGAWAARGHPAALVLHGEPSGHRRLDLRLHPGIDLIDLTDLPALDSAGVDLSAHVARYGAAARRLADRHGSPVVISPNLLGDCYGVAAALCRDDAETLRVVAWHHSDIPYNDRILAHYEPVLARLVAVSTHVKSRLRRQMPARARDVVHIPYGVPIADALPHRPPIAGRPLRLLYTGRIDHEQKRIMALPMLSQVLSRRGITHELVVVGDGPAAAELDEAIADLPAVRRLAAAPPEEVRALLDRADALVLASRYEGLSVSMLEAMARGCVPVVTRVASGADDAVEPGRSGELAEVDAAADEPDAAGALADAVERLLARDVGKMSASAWADARDRYSIERHADAVERMLDAVVTEPPRHWAAGRPWTFTSAGGVSGSVPADGPARLASVLQSLDGRSVVVHGTGRHTRQLRGVLTGSRARIVAFADDDRQEHGSALWGVPVIAPAAAGATGATEVVISSWINQQVIWSRRAVYESQGLTVHRIYA